MPRALLGTAAVLTVVLSLAGGAPAQEAAQQAEPVGPKLTEKLLDMLRREMNSVLGASLQIQDALVRGENARVAELAQSIHDSFILAQEMTPEDRADLRAAVPAAFVERDQAFHDLTGELAAAAREGDGARQRQLFGEVVTACAACHERYATDRFPAFAEQ